ncbi:MAG: EF-hand domain-containing protein [Xanthomonadales bacterium]|nr:EF-hand domain-containing protein [Xanthomonadales bacterium]
MHTRLSRLLATLALLAAPALRAEPAGGRPDPQLPLELSAAREQLARVAAEIDRDGDGYITLEERRAWREAKRAERAKVRVEDFVERRLARLEALDANKDGRIDAEEWKAQRRPHRFGHGKGCGHDGR